MKKNAYTRRGALAGNPLRLVKRLRSHVVSVKKDSAPTLFATLSEKIRPSPAIPEAISDTHLLREANERLVVATVQAQTQKENAEETSVRMAYLAEHDPLTGLPNRSLLTARLAQSIALAQRHKRKVALMYLDLDHFKEINDTHGHTVGDQLLLSAAERLQACVRVSDTVCRQGGDEFVVLLAEIESVQDAAFAAGKLIETMAQPHLIDGHQLDVTLSIGISIYPDDGKDVETVLRNADTAMYHAKRTGRNNYQMFYPGIAIRSMARPEAPPSSVPHKHAQQVPPASLAAHPVTTEPPAEQTLAENSGDACLRLEEAMSELLVQLGDDVGTQERGGNQASHPADNQVDNQHNVLPVRHADGTFRRQDFLDKLFAERLPIDEARAIEVLAELGRNGDSLLNPGDERAGFLVVRSSWRLLWALQHVLVRIRAERRDELLIDSFLQGQALTLLCSIIQVIEICHEKPVNHGPAAVLTQIKAQTVELLKQVALARIHRFRDDGKLLDLPELPFVLKRWQKWESETAVNQWVDGLIADRTQLRRLIPGFLTQSMSHSAVFSGEGTGHSLNLRLLAEFIDLETVAALLGGRRLDDRPEASNSLILSTFNAQYPLYKQGKDPDGLNLVRGVP